MATPVETAVDTYIRALNERDPARRSAMIRECFTEDARLIARSREIRGHAALAEEMARFLAEPTWLRIRMTSAIDASGNTFRYSSAIERRDGTSLDFFDAGLVDESGRISVLLVFAGPLADADGPVVWHADAPSCTP